MHRITGFTKLAAGQYLNEKFSVIDKPHVNLVRSNLVKKPDVFGQIQK